MIKENINNATTNQEISKLEDFINTVDQLGKCLSVIDAKLGNTVSSVVSDLNRFNKAFTVIGDFNDMIDKQFGSLNTKLNKKLKPINDAYTKFSASFSQAFETRGIKGGLDEISNSFADLHSKVIDKLPYIKDSFKTAFSDIRADIAGFPKEFKSKVSGAFASLKDNPFGALTNSLTSFGTLATKVFTVGIFASIEIFRVALEGIKKYFDNLMATNEEFNRKVTQAFSNVTESFKPAIDAFGELFACLVTGSKDAGNSADDIADSFLTVITNITSALSQVVTFAAEVVSGFAEFFKAIMFSANENAEGNTITTWQAISSVITGFASILKELFTSLVSFLSGIWAMFGDDTINIFSKIWGSIAEILGGAVSIISGVMDVLSGIFSGNFDMILDGFVEVWNGITGIFSGLIDYFSGIFDGICSIFSKIGSRISKAVASEFKTVVNSILGFAQDLFNDLIKTLNGAIKIINQIPGVNLPKLPTINIPKLEIGGMVDPGQLFIARESGPELVGSFGARTAVMNNNQIVSAVSDGVFRAVSKAMGSTNNGSYVFQVNLDGREIGRQVLKFNGREFSY